ncbi:calmodulin-like protein 3 [Tanacetum coccineum]
MPKAGLISSDLPTVQPDVESIKGLFFFSNSLRNVIYSDVCSTIAGTRVLFGRYDSNGNVIELALWDDMARNFNKKESDSTEKTVIIAVSSCRVLTYGGLQLYSSPSTYYYLNPDIPDLEEFRTHLELLSNSKEVEKEKAKPLSKYWVRDEEEDMRDAFNVFDQNRDRFITIEELRSVLSSLGLMQGRSIEECRLIIKKVDEDGDGMVNCKEFKQIMKARWFYRLGSLNVYQPR